MSGPVNAELRPQIDRVGASVSLLSSPIFHVAVVK